MDKTFSIKFFKSALSKNTQGEIPVNPSRVNEQSLKCGYIVHPDCCTKAVYNYFINHGWKLNSTFYQTFLDVTSKSRFELFVDQCMHYATTYGSEFEGELYTQNENPRIVDYKSYIVITPITEQELYDKCFSMICSGIALDSQTVDILCSYIIDCGKCTNVDNIKNKEAQAYIASKLNIYPTSAEDFFRCLVFQATSKSMIIKNAETTNYIKYGNTVDFSVFSDDQLIKLSQIFYRYKPLFLAFKRQQKINTTPINKIRRFAEVYHKPMVEGFWESILHKIYHTHTILHEVSKLDNNYKIVKLLQAIKERQLLINNGGKSLYIIRNGKSYLKEKEYNKDILQYLTYVYNMLYGKLIDNLKKKSCVVKFPKYLELACPISEKQFIGNIPYGSFYKMKHDNFIGIYWRNEWGTYDFDLSIIDDRGRKIGWNSDFYNDKKSIAFSGDMTCADPEATEVLYCKNNCPNGVICVNRFNGVEGSKFKLFFGSQNITPRQFRKNFMVDPNCIELEEMLISDKKEQVIGYVINNNVYFTNLQTSSSRISNTGTDILEVLNRKTNTYINLKNVLLSSGFEEYDEEKHDHVDLDLTDLNKNTLIDLFS